MFCMSICYNHKQGIRLRPMNQMKLNQLEKALPHSSIIIIYNRRVYKTLNGIEFTLNGTDKDQIH